ncbi:peptidase M23 [Portibacter lacus]|uniref:Peptidase M23 n=2 Tax=Portibacter lacus TaxID=1099794 RepID=A0AA37WFB6_9BACT|nr:peptidase M23 [Portibacter lacus]
MGIDIKSSRGQHPDPILAADEGYISRINVSRAGYGNALYIDHPSGYTTVYGHLKSFHPSIDSIVQKIQADSQSFEITYYPDSLLIPVRKGQEIAKMGNSGSSHGPHLHFEIRETKSEAPLNPMRFNIKPIDKVAPIIPKVKIYYLDNKFAEIDGKILTPTVNGSNYTLPKQKIGAWRIGIGIQAYDPMVYNKNGIHKMEMFVDDKKVYQFAFDSITFDDTRYINAHIDYKYYKKTKTRLHRLFKLPGNQLPSINSIEPIINLYKDKPQKVLINISDFEGNISSLAFDVERSEDIAPPTPKIFNYFIPHNEANIVEQNNIKLIFPERALYEDLFLYVNSSSSEYLTNVYHIGNEITPLHRPLKLIIDSLRIDSSLMDKVCLLECTKPDRISTYGGNWKDGHFVASVSSFGNYAIGIDTIAPEIKPIQKSDNFSKSSRMSFIISDNFSDSGSARGLRYNATINGQWAKFAYDLKTKKITHHFDTPPENKSHHLVLEVTDDRNNTRRLEKNFIR